MRGAHETHAHDAGEKGGETRTGKCQEAGKGLLVDMQDLVLDGHRRLGLERLVLTTSREWIFLESTGKLAVTDANIAEELHHHVHEAQACLEAPSLQMAIGLEPPSDSNLEAWTGPAIGCHQMMPLRRAAEAVQARLEMNIAVRLSQTGTEVFKALSWCEKQARDIVVLRARQTMPPTFNREAFATCLDAAHMCTTTYSWHDYEE